MKINGNIYPDTRTKTEYRFHVRIQWNENGKQQVKKLPTRIKLPKEDYDLKHHKVIGTSDLAIKVRNKIMAIKDLINRLDLPERWENIDAVRNFIENDQDLIKEIKLERFVDFAKEYVRINARILSKSRLRQYNVLITNLQMFMDLSRRGDFFLAMGRSSQTIWLSDFVDFLLYNAENGKKPYENSSVIQSMGQMGGIRKAFPEAGLLVDPLSIVKDLRIGSSEAVYCTAKEVKAIVEAWPTADGDEWRSVSLFLFSVVTGLRFDELKGVVYQAIHTENGLTTLTFTSGKKGWINRVPLGSLACRILNEAANRRFLRNQPDPKYLLPIFNSAKANKALHSFLKKISVFSSEQMRVRYRGAERLEQSEARHQAITMHSARHTYSHLLSSGKLDISEVGQLLSHGSVETTNRHYKHLNSEEVQRKALTIINQIS